MKKSSLRNGLFIGLGIATMVACTKENLNSENNRADAPAHTMDRVDYSRVGEYFEMTSYRESDEMVRFNEEMTESRKQVFRAEANSYISVTGENGTRLTSVANNFVNSRGELIEGTVEIELIEVFSKADMVLLDKATSGITEGGDAITALVSGGELFVRVTQGGEEVELVGAMHVEVPTDTPDPDMRKFVEVDAVPGDELLWEIDEDGAMEVEEREGGEGDFVTAYDILPGEWGWTNIDKWAADPCAKTDIFVEVPAGHDASNTEVYLSYDGDPGRLANFDMWDGSRFTEHYGQICIGIPCHFIAVTTAGGSLEYAIQGATITAGHVEVIGGFTPISEAALIAAINALP